MTGKDLQRAMEVVNRIAAIKTQLEAVKPLYDELDELTAELSDVAEVNQTLATNDGRFMTLIDNFAEKILFFVRQQCAVLTLSC